MKYRQMGVSLLEQLKDFSRKDMRVLLALIEHSCPEDNCLQVSQKELAEHAGVQPSDVSACLSRFAEKSVVKKGVLDIYNKRRVMINPEMVWSTSRDKMHYACNMYALGNHLESYDTSKLEKNLSGKIDASTGELYSEYQHRLGELIARNAEAIYET